MDNFTYRSKLHLFFSKVILLVLGSIILSACNALEERRAEATAQTNLAIMQQKAQISPPSEGLFLVNDDFSTTEIPYETVQVNLSPISKGYLSNYYKLPLVKSTTPVFVFSSTNSIRFDVNKLAFYHPRPMTGFIFDMDQSPCKSAQVELGGQLMPSNATILTVDGIGINNCRELDEYIKSKRPLDPVQFEFREGTQTTTVNTTLTLLTFRDFDTANMIQEWGDNYVVYYPQQELEKGIYCYWIREHQNGFCFRIE